MEEQKDQKPPLIQEGTQRKDGTWRKPVKIKPGYQNPEQVLQKKYKIPQLRSDNERKEYCQLNGGGGNLTAFQKPEDDEDDRYYNNNGGGYKNRFTNSKKNQRNNNQNNQPQQRPQQRQKIDFDSLENFPGLGGITVKKNSKEFKKDTEKQQKQERIPEQNDTLNNYINDNQSQKNVRKINKKLKQIEILEEKLNNGQKLNDDEFDKIDTKDDLLNQLERLQINDN